jgi:VWFA-related protein
MFKPREFVLRCALAVSLAAASGGADLCQTQGAPPSKGPIRTVTNEVTVPVTVTDQHGAMVLDLEQKDFHVFDEGAEQTIDHWELGGDPLAVALLIETSSRLHAMIPAIHSMSSIFTETVMALDGKAAVITYDSSVDVLQPFTKDHDAVANAITGTKFEVPEKTLYDGMDEAVRLLQEQPTKWRRILLVIGESQDSGSAAKLGDVVREAERANISIYVVGPSGVAADLRGDNMGTDPLKLRGLPPITATPCSAQVPGCLDLATPALWLLERGTNEIRHHQLEVAAVATGGIDYRGFRDSALLNALDKIGGELHAQYILDYRPNPESAPGFHTIRVTVSRPDVSVRTRPGYYLPSP